MRARILIPILILLVVFCGALGYAVYANISSATSDLLNKQIDDTLNFVENEIIEAKNTSSGTLSDASYQELIAGYATADGGVFVVNESGTVIADTQSILTGMSVTTHDWYQEASKEFNSEFYASYGGTQIYAHGVLMDGKLIVSYMSSKAIRELQLTPLYVIGVVGVICVVIMGILIYFLITRLLINPIESLDEQIRELPHGEEIDLKPLKSCPELAASAEELNELFELKFKGGVPPEENQSLAQSEAQGEDSSLVLGEGAVGDREIAVAVESLVAQQEAAAAVERYIAEHEPEQEPEQAPEPAAESPVDRQEVEQEAAKEEAAQQDVATEESISGEPGAEAAGVIAELEQEHPTSFVFVDMLREVFEQRREIVTANKLKFSLLVDNKMPQSIRADRDEMRARIGGLLDNVFSETEPGSIVEAELSVTATNQVSDKEHIAITFDVHYNGQEEKILLQAIRGY